MVRWAEERGAPLHVHLSEQTAENDACLTAHGRTPTRLLADHGVLGPRTTGIHNTHLTAEDIELLGNSGTGTCMCPTTERDLADGIGPAAALQRAGSPLSLGSDSHAVIDLFEEARAMELNERLRTHVRGHWTAAALLRAASADGHTALGRPDAGTLEPGAPADLTTVALDSVRTAGAGAAAGGRGSGVRRLRGGRAAHRRGGPSRRPRRSPHPGRGRALGTRRGHRRPARLIPDTDESCLRMTTTAITDIACLVTNDPPSGTGPPWA